MEELKNSKNDLKKKFENEKNKIIKKSEKLNSIKLDIRNNLENLLEKKKYEEFFLKKQNYLVEFKSINEIKINVSDIPFAYFSNTIKFEDFGSIKYYKSFKDIEQIYNEKKLTKRNSLNFIKTDENTKNTKSKSKEKHLNNIFQDNLLNNKNYSTSPKKSLNSKNSHKVEKPKGSYSNIFLI